MQKQYLECGKIVTTHGLHGEVKVQPWSDSPDFLCNFETVYLGSDKKPYPIARARAQKNMLILKLGGVESIDDALALRGKVLYIDRDEDILEDGEYFVQDLIGLAVRDADSGEEYGRLTDVFFTGANDVYELTGPDEVKRLFPAIKDVIIETDTQSGVMRIRPLKGLFDNAD
ncbi:MAG: ribosome maturation factor RimM [Oscillospiraceae bacterium]|nr:ribosome maturation factor RimM [Oscillospiraceae bacterium]